MADTKLPAREFDMERIINKLSTLELHTTSQPIPKPLTNRASVEFSSCRGDWLHFYHQRTLVPQQVRLLVEPIVTL